MVTHHKLKSNRTILKALFVLSHENINWWLNDGLHCKSELHDGTYSLLSQTGESQNTIKMLMLSVF